MSPRLIGVGQASDGGSVWATAAAAGTGALLGLGSFRKLFFFVGCGFLLINHSWPRVRGAASPLILQPHYDRCLKGVAWLWTLTMIRPATARILSNDLLKGPFPLQIFGPVCHAGPESFQVQAAAWVVQVLRVVFAHPCFFRFLRHPSSTSLISSHPLALF